MLQTLTIPPTTARLDISRLLKSTPSPPPRSAPPSQPSILRSTSVSVPTPTLLARPEPPSHRTSNSSTISTSTGSAFQPTSSQAPLYSSQALLQTNIESGQPPIDIPQPAHISSKRPPPSQPHPSASPAKKQSKWTPSEDALIIDLRGSGMKWEDISKRLPGRSAISCRLHYQNYLERRSEWDEEKKNRLARLYERLKPDLWTPLATELGVPWRAAEAMHWHLGEHDMARRAGVVPFSMANPPSNNPLSNINPTNQPIPLNTNPLNQLNLISNQPAFSQLQPQPGGLQQRSPPQHAPQLANLEGVRTRRSGGRGLPSVAELEGGVPAFVGMGRGRRRRSRSR